MIKRSDVRRRSDTNGDNGGRKECVREKSKDEEMGGRDTYRRETKGVDIGMLSGVRQA